MSFWRWGLIALLCACKGDELAAACGGDCPAGEVCVAGACQRVCGIDSECGQGFACVEGYCQVQGGGGGGDCEPACVSGYYCNATTDTCMPARVPSITSIDGTGTPDSDPTHTSKHLRDRLVVRGTNLDNTVISLRRAGGQSVSLERCGVSTDTTVEVALPDGVVAGEHTLTVTGQSGATCDSTVWLLQGEAGSGGSGSCSSSIIDCDDTDFVVDPSGASALNEVLAVGTLTVGGGYGYTQQTLTTGQSTPRCACDTSATGADCAATFGSYDDQGTTCYDWTSGGQYPFTRPALSSPLSSLSVEHNGVVSVGRELHSPVLVDSDNPSYSVNPAAASQVADLTVTGAFTCTNCIDTGDLAPNSVGQNKLIDGAVTSAKIADGTIVDADIANMSYGKISGARNALTVCISGSRIVTWTPRGGAARNPNYNNISYGQPGGGCGCDCGGCAGTWAFAGYLY